MQEPINIPPNAYEDPAATATQLRLLLDAATSAVDEEFKRTERLDQKARNQATFAATLFAGAQALIVGLLNGTLTDGKDSSFVPYLAVLGALATVAAAIGFVLNYRAWRLHDEQTVELSGISGEDYIGAAMVGNPRVGVNLIRHYAEIAQSRRKVNDRRSSELAQATIACVATTVVVAIEVIVAFIAVAVR